MLLSKQILGLNLRCLIVKSHFDLKGKFILGDFSQEGSDLGKFDLVVASGVLYLMVEPVRFLEKFAQLSDGLFLWTHYFDYDFSQWHPHLLSHLSKGKWNYKDPDLFHYKGLDIKVIKQEYGETLGWSGFRGGPEDYSYWIEKQGLMLLYSQLGYQNVEAAFDDIGHQNGPSVCTFATK